MPAPTVRPADVVSGAPLAPSRRCRMRSASSGRGRPACAYLQAKTINEQELSASGSTLRTAASYKIRAPLDLRECDNGVVASTQNPSTRRNTQAGYGVRLHDERVGFGQHRPAARAAPLQAALYHALCVLRPGRLRLAERLDQRVPRACVLAPEQGLPGVVSGSPGQRK